MSDDLERARSAMLCRGEVEHYCPNCANSIGERHLQAALLSFLDMDEAGVMVERVARALCIEHEGEADRQVYKRTGPDTYEPTIKSWERWVPSARAVLSELRKMAGEKG